MPLRDRTGIGDRVPRELLDGDLSIAFSFVEMAEEESGRGNQQGALQLLQSAQKTLDSIRDRLLHLTADQRGPFEPRCAELEAAIGRVRASDSEPESDA